jgi:hypothetical protein
MLVAIQAIMVFEMNRDRFKKHMVAPEISKSPAAINKW